MINFFLTAVPFKNNKSLAIYKKAINFFCPTSVKGIDAFESGVKEFLLTLFFHIYLGELNHLNELQTISGDSPKCMVSRYEQFLSGLAYLLQMEMNFPPTPSDF